LRPRLAAGMPLSQCVRTIAPPRAGDDGRCAAASALRLSPSAATGNKLHARVASVVACITDSRLCVSLSVERVDSTTPRAFHVIRRSKATTRSRPEQPVQASEMSDTIDNSVAIRRRGATRMASALHRAIATPPFVTAPFHGDASPTRPDPASVLRAATSRSRAGPYAERNRHWCARRGSGGN
jgi:hypothetical protein